MTASRLDVSESRLGFLRLALRAHINPTFGERAPEELVPAEIQAWVMTLAGELAPRTVQA